MHQLLQHPAKPCSWGTNPAGHGFRSLITQLGRLVQTNDYLLFAGLWADHQGLVSHSGDSTKPCRLSNRPGKRAEIGEWLDFFFQFFYFCVTGRRARHSRHLCHCSYKPPGSKSQIEVYVVIMTEKTRMGELDKLVIWSLLIQ